MIRLPVRILSDLHLGHRASRITDVESLRPLLEGMGTVIFNGDTWEELAEPWRERSGRMLAELQRMISEEGCDAVFLRGNHDPGWEGPAFLSLAGGRIAITHGDALLRASSPWKREILASRDIVEEIWNRHPSAGSELESRFEVAREIATRLPSLEHPYGRNLLARVVDAALPPRRALAMLSAWTNQGKRGARFCETYLPQAEFLVIGHFHCVGIRHVGGKTVINTGSFVVPGPARWVDWNGESLSTGGISERYGSCFKRPESRSWKFFGNIKLKACKK